MYPNCEKAQLDCILINKKWQNSATNAEAYNSFSSVGSDHRIITAKLKLRANKLRKHQPTYNWQASTENTDVVQKYQLEIKNRFNTLNLEGTDQSIESIYRSITIAHEHAGAAHITRKSKLAWATVNELTNRKKSRAARPSGDHPSERIKRGKNILKIFWVDLHLYHHIKKKLIRSSRKLCRFLSTSLQWKS